MSGGERENSVRVVGAGLYAPGYPNLGAWLAGEPAAEGSEPSGELIDRRARRRTSAFTRALADAYGEALGASGYAKDAVAAVFGSALGEAATMIGILDQIYGAKSGGAAAAQPGSTARDGRARASAPSGNVSPMRFAMSVHNAAAGVVSTTTKNRGITTSLGADFDTPAMALVEAVGLVAAHRQPVVVVCGDEQAPDDLVRGLDLGWDMLAVALVLAPAAPATDATATTLARLRLRAGGPQDGADLFAPPDAQPPLAVSQRLARSPQVGLLDCVAAIHQRYAGVVRLDRGRGRGYHAELSYEG